ncbi:hypothetical protein F8M41_012857 [Gigaspora margarita]|uniref:Uncharacterized protein n=1 Tax=Gigaspora margarita TaxID=4874 RepID=A0A8H4EPG0_GIGMA|nr:hypothetical protein F8M41_012857 [Gigaspora margarita]
MSNKNQTDIIKKVFNLLKEGEEKVTLDQNHRDIILVLGNTGSGKSTFVQYLNENKTLKSQPWGGSFRIVGNDRIQGGFTSKTIFPELFLEIKTLIMTVLVLRIREIILTVDSSLFFSSRNEFPNLVEHTSSFIKDMTKFKESILLILTKADIGIQKEKDYKKDIAMSLIEVKENSKEELKNPNVQNKKLHEDTIKLVDALLVQKNDQYTNFQLFKKPKNEGYLHLIDSFEQERKDLVNILKEDIRFVVKNNDDFGFTISDKSKNEINKLSKVINEDITKLTGYIGDDLRKYFEARIHQSNDIHKLKDDIENKYIEMLIKLKDVKLKENVSNLKVIEEFVQKINNEMDKHQINLSVVKEKRSETILNNGSYLDFLKTVKPEVTSMPETWVRGFDELNRYLNDSKLWYQFLVALHDKLSEYEIQKNRKKYIVTEVTEWGHGKQSEDKTLKISINKDNFNQFLKKVQPPFLPPEYNDISQIEVEKLFNATTSDIKSLKIFGLNTLFIDADLSGQKFQGVSVTCISPRWEIRDKHKMVLDGGSNLLLLHGENGRPGLPGGTAGSFFGIYREIVNRNGLKLTTDGGKGGPGQNGGDGRRGDDGEDFKYDKVKDQKIDINNQDPLSDYYKVITNDKTIEPDIRNPGPLIVDKTFEVWGKKGLNGGNGGDGGKGGEGGYNGTINLINTYHPNDATDLTPFRSQNAGEGGIGGKGGAGGKRGNGEEVKYHHYIHKPFIDKFTWTKVKDFNIGERADSGKDGVNNSNAQNIQSPSKPFEHFQFAIDINNYKGYLREDINDRIKQGPLITFHQEIDHHHIIQFTYNTLGLFDELHGLENQFHDLIGHRVDVLPFYESFLERVMNYVNLNADGQYSNPYAQEDFTSADRNSYKKALSYLYTTVLSKIWSLKTIKTPFLIVDIRGYFNLIEESIELLEKAKEQVAINQYKNQYKRDIEENVKEAETFIKEKIILEIDRIKDEIDKKIESLIAEIVKLIKAEEQNEQDLRKKKTRFR